MRFYILLLLSLFSLPLVSQDLRGFDEEKPVLMKNEFMGGLNIHSSGWGIELRRTYSKTVNLKNSFEFAIVGMKHPKEIRTVNPLYDRAKSYIYGKANSLLIFRPSFGRQHVLYGKTDKLNIEIRGTYSGGLSLGIAKPVYLDILNDNPNSDHLFITTEKYDPFRHYVDNIYGKSAFGIGLDELKFHPGLFARAGTLFEFASDFEKIWAVEVGISADYFSKPVPIMALIENKSLFFNFYIIGMWGKKW